jgi:hypothetical protein
MSYNIMIFTTVGAMEHFRLRQRMTLTTKIYSSGLYTCRTVVGQCFR